MLDNLDDKQRKLFGKSKRRIREIARDAYIEGRKQNLSLEETQKLGERKLREARLGFWETILISVAIWFVKLLIEWWWNRKVDDPGSEPLEGEPS